MLDRQGRLIWLNQPAADLTAAGPGLIGEPLRDALPQLAGEIESARQQSLAEGIEIAARVRLGPQGVLHDVRVQPLPEGSLLSLQAAPGDAPAGAAEDRRLLAAEASLREAQAQLEQRERQLSTILNHNIVGILYARISGEVILVNDRLCEILGRSRETVAAMPYANYTHPDDLPGNRLLFDRGVRTGQPFQLEKRYVRPDGSSVWCAVNVSFVRDPDGEIGSIVTVAEDISARKQAEQTLKEEQALLQTVVDSVSDLIFLKDRDGRFLLTNRALEESCGPVLGRQGAELFPPDLHLGYQAHDRDVMATGERRAVIEQVPVRGQLRTFETIKTPWRPNGEIVGVLGVSRDVTEQTTADRALRTSESLNRSIVEASTDCIKLMDLRGKVLFINTPGLAAMEIDDLADVLGRPWEDFCPEETREDLREALHKARAGQVGRMSGMCPTFKGTAKWWDVVVSPVFGPDGQPMQLVGISRDITHQKAVEEHVRWAATHDALTRLPNRMLFNDRLGEALKAADAAGGSVGLLQIDIDRFKEVNDTLGHEAGDTVLRAFASRMRGILRTTDTVARLGGDEFAVVLPGLGGAEEIERVVASILTRMREPFAYDGRVLDCRASIGASLFPEHGRTAHELLTNADIAMYMAKGRGRGGLVVYEPGMRLESERRAAMNKRARTALAGREIIPFYQPKIDLGSGRHIGFEALLRIQAPGAGRALGPDVVMTAFEDLELAPRIGDRMLSACLADMQRWREEGLEFGHVAINAASAEFRQDDFAERVLAQLRSSGLPPSCLQVEVTETVFVGRGAEHVDRALTLLHANGVSVALDDFGTGYASLTHLKTFPVSLLKIDQRFVGHVIEDEGDAAIVRAVLELGRSLGIDVVAEGVETEPQRLALQQLGCRHAQGRLFCEPRPPAEAVSWLRRRARVETVASP